MNHLFVWLRSADSVIRLVGELATTAASRQDGSFKSEFEYLPGWLDDPKAIALDPVSLPLDARRPSGSKRARCRRTMTSVACLMAAAAHALPGASRRLCTKLCRSGACAAQTFCCAER